jgi:phage gpG-like protein
MFKKGTQQGKGFSFRAFEITIPARPYLAINQEDEEKIIDKITKYHT